MIPPLLTKLDSDLLKGLKFYQNITQTTNKHMSMTTRRVVTGPGVSFNFVIPVNVPDYFLDETKLGDSTDKIITQEEFVDALPLFLHRLYSHTGLTEAVKQISEDIGGKVLYILSEHRAWWISSPRMLVLINEEP